MERANVIPEYLCRSLYDDPARSQLSLESSILVASDASEDEEDEENEIDEALLQSAAEAMSQGVIMGRAGEASEEVLKVVEEARARQERHEMALDGYVDVAYEAAR